jgi:hypothetical protein
VLENRVLRRIFGPKTDEVAGSWRRLNNWELCNLYASPSIIRMIKSRMRRRICNMHGKGEKCKQRFGQKI